MAALSADGDIAPNGAHPAAPIGRTLNIAHATIA
jgi:hypothetical protein